MFGSYQDKCQPVFKLLIRFSIPLLLKPKLEAIAFLNCFKIRGDYMIIAILLVDEAIMHYNRFNM